MAALSQRDEVLLEVLRAHDVEDDIALVLQLLGEVLLVVVDEDVRAELLAGLELFVRSSRHRDGGAEVFRHLDGEGADTARAAVDEDGLALF